MEVALINDPHQPPVVERRDNDPPILGVNETEDWPPLSHYIVAPPHRPLQDVTADNRVLSDKRKKTVRFDHHDGHRQGSQGSQESHRDSGIDTSSTFTSSEDSTRGDFPKVLRATL